MIAAASSTSTPSFVPLIKLYILANGSTEAAMPSSALRKSKLPPALSAVELGIEYEADRWIQRRRRALNRLHRFFYFPLSVAVVVDCNCSILPDVADFSFSSWSILSKAFCICCSMPLTVARRDSNSELCARAAVGTKNIKPHRVMPRFAAPMLINETFETSLQYKPATLDDRRQTDVVMLRLGLRARSYREVEEGGPRTYCCLASSLTRTDVCEVAN